MQQIIANYENRLHSAIAVLGIYFFNLEVQSKSTAQMHLFGVRIMRCV